MKYIKSLFIIFLLYCVWRTEQGDPLNQPAVMQLLPFPITHVVAGFYDPLSQPATMHFTLALCSVLSSCNASPTPLVVNEYRPQLTPYHFYSPSNNDSPKEVAPADIKPELFSSSKGSLL